MSFLIGYFGKNSSTFNARFKALSVQHCDPQSVITQYNEQSCVYAGIYHNRSQQSDAVVSFNATRGLLVGKIFSKESYQRMYSFDTDKQMQILADPILLTKEYWGRYLGVFPFLAEQKILLIRDPLGLSTLFYMQLSDGIIFASDISLIYDCLEDKPSINWNYFADYMIGAQSASSLTPFNGIIELQPGMGLHYCINGSIKKQFLWDISSFTSAPIIDESAFEEKLLHVLKECTKAWVQDSKSICVELSGGADSSAVMILLSEVLRKDQKLIAVNYSDSSEPSTDESQYAKEVAELCNAELKLLDWKNISPFEESSYNWRTNRPSTFLLFPRVCNQLNIIISANEQTEMFNGQGGDHIFLAPPPEQALSDYWIQKGLRRSFPILQELSGIYRTSYSSLFWKNIKATAEYHLGKKSLPEGYANSYSHNLLNKQTEKEHYLDSVIKNFPQAKKKQIQGLAHAVIFSERGQKNPDLIYCHPLLSQPVVELALQIPAYQSFKDGYDRIIFRKAISRIKKPKAMWRRIKGHVTSTVIKSLSTHLDEIQQLLLNGSLLKAGLIEKELLEKYLLEIKHGKIENNWAILKSLSAQKWLNLWGL